MKHDHGAELAAVKNDTGRSETETASDEVAWLIEGLAMQDTPPLKAGTCYWAGGHPSYESFTNDHLEAVRFARRADANRVIARLLSEFADPKNSTFLTWGLIAVEHMWLAATEPTTEVSSTTAASPALKNSPPSSPRLDQGRDDER